MSYSSVPNMSDNLGALPDKVWRQILEISSSLRVSEEEFNRVFPAIDPQPKEQTVGERKRKRGDASDEDSHPRVMPSTGSVRNHPDFQSNALEAAEGSSKDISGDNNHYDRAAHLLPLIKGVSTGIDIHQHIVEQLRALSVSLSAAEELGRIITDVADSRAGQVSRQQKSLELLTKMIGMAEKEDAGSLRDDVVEDVDKVLKPRQKQVEDDMTRLVDDEARTRQVAKVVKRGPRIAAISKAIIIGLASIETLEEQKINLEKEVAMQR